MYGTSHEGQFNDLEGRLSLHSCVTLGMLYDFCKFGIWIFEGFRYSEFPWLILYGTLTLMSCIFLTLVSIKNTHKLSKIQEWS
jgi:hypothetical protein